MQQSTSNIDDLLDEWEQIKYVTSHIGPNDELDIFEYMRLKGLLMTYSHELRFARLNNDAKTEQEYTVKFTEAYNNFVKDFVFKVLKNERTS